MFLMFKYDAACLCGILALIGHCSPVMRDWLYRNYHLVVYQLAISIRPVTQTSTFSIRWFIASPAISGLSENSDYAAWGFHVSDVVVSGFIGFTYKMKPLISKSALVVY